MQQETFAPTAPVAVRSGSAFGRFLYTLIMFLLEGVIIAVVMATAIATLNPNVLYLAIPIQFIYAMVCFFVKKGNRPLMIFWGILALASDIWWVLMISGK